MDFSRRRDTSLGPQKEICRRRWTPLCSASEGVPLRQEPVMRPQKEPRRRHETGLSAHKASRGPPKASIHAQKEACRHQNKSRGRREHAHRWANPGFSSSRADLIAEEDAAVTGRDMWRRRPNAFGPRIDRSRPPQGRASGRDRSPPILCENRPRDPHPICSGLRARQMDLRSGHTAHGHSLGIVPSTPAPLLI